MSDADEMLNILNTADNIDRELFNAAKGEIKKKYTRKTQESQDARAIKAKRRREVRRVKSAEALAKALPEPIERGMSYHVISSGNVDASTFLAHIANQVSLDYCLFSTWCMSSTSVETFKDLFDRGRISRIDGYCGQLFQAQYSDEWLVMCGMVEPFGGRIAIMKNHSKLFLGCNVAKNFYFVVETSANMNYNPRTEQFAIHCDRDLFHFYLDYFDGVRSIERNFDDWIPWRANWKN